MSGARRHRVSDGRDDLGIQVHSEIDDYGLDPYAFRVYARMARRAGGHAGVHWESVKKTAEACRMSPRRVHEALRLLEAQGLIHRVEGHERGETVEYTLTPRRTWAKPLTSAPDADPSAPGAHPPAPGAHPPLHRVQTPSAPGADEVKPLKLDPDLQPPLPPKAPAATEPSAADKPPRRESTKRLHWAMVQAWNDHRSSRLGSLPRCTGVTPTLSKMLDRALKDIAALDLDGSGRPPDPVEVIRRATVVVAEDPYWHSNRYSLQNLLAGGKFTGKAEAYEPPPQPATAPTRPPTAETEWGTTLRLAKGTTSSELPRALSPAGRAALAAIGGWVEVASASDEADAGDSTYLLDLASRFRAAYHQPTEEVAA